MYCNCLIHIYQLIKNYFFYSRTYLLAVELTLVFDLERLLIIESPQLTTPLLVMLNVRKRYRSSLSLGLYGFSGREQTLGLMWSGTENK